MKRTFRHRTYFLFALALLICLTTPSLVHAQMDACTMYLQSAGNYSKIESGYGHHADRPIKLKASPQCGCSDIIDKYVDNLWSTSSKDPNKNTEKLKILSKELIDTERIRRKCQSDSLGLFRVELSNEDGTQKFILYFELSKRKKKFYPPDGFLYGRIAG